MFKRTVRTTIFCIATFLPMPVLAYQIVQAGKITYVENGWFGEGLAIKHSHNTAGCSSPDNEYAIRKNHPSYDELFAMVLLAFSTNSDVSLIVENTTCLFGGRVSVLSIRME